MDRKLHGQPCFVYLRISADKEGKELGVKRQEEDCRALAAQLGLVVMHVFCDNDISASTNTDDERPEYDEMMARLEAGPVRIVLAVTTNRLTRKPEETEHQIKLARKYGVQYLYARGQSLDLQFAANRRMARYQAVNDAGEAEELQERVLRKKLADAREGKTHGGCRTYGYGLVIGTNPATGKDVCDPYQVRPEEVEVLQEGKRRTLAGDGQLQIVMDWNARGIPTSKGNLWKVGKFKRTLLKECYVVFDDPKHPTDCPCLRNPKGNGTRVHHADRHRAKWPGIFTRAEHEALVSMFDTRAQRWNHGPVKGRTYLLTGMVECGGTWPNGDRMGQYCGGVMYGQGKKENGRYIRRYACKKYDNHGYQIGCCTVFRIADAVEAFVSEQVLWRFDSPEVHRALAPADNEQRMSEVIQQLAELQARRETLAAEYAAGEHDKDDYRVMLKTVKESIDLAEAERKRLLSDKAKSLALPDSGLREAWESASMEWRHSVIRLIVDKVIIHPCRPGGSKWVAPDGKVYNFNPDSISISWLH